MRHLSPSLRRRPQNTCRIEWKPRERPDAYFRAHVSLCSMPAAGEWLITPPADDDRRLKTETSHASVSGWVTLSLLRRMGRFGDLPLVCSCESDPTVRHNKLRSLFYANTLDAEMRPERERERERQRKIRQDFSHLVP